MEMGNNQVQTRPLNHESNAEVQIMKKANHETVCLINLDQPDHACANANCCPIMSKKLV